MQQQIEENNRTGDFAEGTLKDDLYKPVDEVIVDKKMNIEAAEDDLPPDDIFKDVK